MSSFTTPLIISPLPDGRKWKLVKQFRYDVGKKGSDNQIMVPVGFITDFVSVPFIFWSMIPRWGKYGKAAIVHDYLYQTKSRTRREADDIFREGMEVLGVSRWRRFLMYWAVRAFGWMAW